MRLLWHFWRFSPTFI